MADQPIPTLPPPSMELLDLAAASVLGHGAKGVVFLVRSRSSGETFALKVISKPHETAKSGGGYRRIWFERDVLLALHHPLLPSLRGVVSTEKLVGFAIECCPGGDLNALRRRQTEKMFSQEIIRFYAVELVLVLEYLHNMGIVYRDLKPENVLIQENGHIMLVDFDLSTKLPASESPPETPTQRFEAMPPQIKRKRYRSLLRCFSRNACVSPELPGSDVESCPLPPSLPKSKSFVGTEEYVAPEIIKGKGHDFAVDWWCLGVVLYEMLYGRTPFRGQNRKETFYRILTKAPDLDGEPTALRDLIGRMLEKDPEKRVAVNKIRQHEFFRGVDWESVVEVARPPFIPPGAVREEEVEGLDVEKVVEEMSRNARAAKGKCEPEGGNCSAGDVDVF